MKTVFVDVDTQLDFVFPSGALYAPGAERIVPAAGALNRFAAARGIPVISTTDAHAEDDAEFANWPPHCIAGTLGQRKPESTLLERRVVARNREPLPETAGAQQIVVEKQTLDVFETTTIAGLLERLGAEHAVVYGVVTEVCVLFAARGLQRREMKVTLVTDSVAALDVANAARALDELRAGGCRLSTRQDLEVAAPAL